MRSLDKAVAAPVVLTTLMRALSVRARIMPLVLMLVVGLNGIGPCLCAGESVQSAADPHACCARAKTDDAGRLTVKATGKPCSPACAGTHGALALAVPANGGEQLNAVPLADAPSTRSPVAHDMPAALRALDASQRRSPPLRPTVLRI